MCLALYKPKNIAADWKKLQNGMESNRDGAGFAVAKDGQLIVEKGFFRFEDLKLAFEPFEMYDAIVHFRMATHGDKNKNNCHPFDLRDFGSPEDLMPVAVIHNGIFSQANDDQKQWSDTWHVCRDVLHPLWIDHGNVFGKPSVRTLGDEYVGNYNKLVFLAADGTCSIWGEKNGHWKDGVWYSNYSYMDHRYADPRYTKTRRYGSVVNGKWEYDEEEEWGGWSMESTTRKDTTTHHIGNTIKLEVGQRYLYRNGEVTGPLVSTTDSVFLFKDPTLNHTFKANGKYTVSDASSGRDLISLAEDTPDDDDDFEAIMNLDVELPKISLIAVNELRECGYTDYELEKIYITDNHSGLVEELAHMYAMHEDDITRFLDNKLREYVRDEQLEDLLEKESASYAG